MASLVLRMSYSSTHYIQRQQDQRVYKKLIPADRFVLKADPSAEGSELSQFVDIASLCEDIVRQIYGQLFAIRRYPDKSDDVADTALVQMMASLLWNTLHTLSLIMWQHPYYHNRETSMGHWLEGAIYTGSPYTSNLFMSLIPITSTLEAQHLRDVFYRIIHALSDTYQLQSLHDYVEESSHVSPKRTHLIHQSMLLNRAGYEQAKKITMQ